LSVEAFLKSSDLDDREKEMLQCRIEGMNLREIANKFGFSESRASQLLVKIKKAVYNHYSKDQGLSFGLADYKCPSCEANNVVSDRVEKFRCDTCDSDLRIVSGVPILAITDSELLGEDLDV
jgi:predicted  nucleic acid-binding Zn ribbon protein